MRGFLAAFSIVLSLSLMVGAGVAPVQAVVVDEKPLEDPAKEAAARALMKEIRCLVCQNQSIEDSNADLAKDLRMLVRERIALGDTPANVRAYLVDRYGDWVLMEPPLNQMTLLLWGSPFLFLALVLFLVYTSRRQPTAVPLSEAEKQRLAGLMTRKDEL
jgi:cytochrome c-type biogenesis protein CcmH